MSTKGFTLKNLSLFKNIDRYFRETKIERTAAYHIFFRSPIDLILIIGPMISAISAFVYSPKLYSVDGDYLLSTIRMEEMFLTRFLVGLKTAIFLLIIIFVVFRWSNIHTDGSYGYWVALGVNRQVFYLFSFVSFLRYIYLGVILGFTMIFFIAGPVITPFLIITSFTLILSTVLNMFGIAVIIAEFIKNPPISSFVYAATVGSVLIFNTKINLLSIMFQSDIIRDDVLLTFLLSTMTGTLLMLLGYWKHQKTDLDL